jgi:hypothetical protein
MEKDTNVGKQSTAGHSVLRDDTEHPSMSGQDTNDENSEAEGEYEEGFIEGMDHSGFIADSLKPLTPEALAAFKVAQDRAGVIYISRIPPECSLRRFAT